MSFLSSPAIGHGSFAFTSANSLHTSDRRPIVRVHVQPHLDGSAHLCTRCAFFYLSLIYAQTHTSSPVVSFAIFILARLQCSLVIPSVCVKLQADNFSRCKLQRIPRADPTVCLKQVIPNKYLLAFQCRPIHFLYLNPCLLTFSLMNQNESKSTLQLS